MVKSQVGLLALCCLVILSNTSQPLFADYFDGDLSLWTVDKGAWRIDNGELVGVGYGGGVDAWIYAGSTEWINYALTAKISIVTGNAQLVLRSTCHWQNEYRIELWSRDPPGGYANTLVLAKYQDGQSVLFLDHVQSPVPITNGSIARAEVMGASISLYINDGLAFNYTDPDPLSAGRMGLGVVWDWTCRFDGVVVERLPREALLTNPSQSPETPDRHYRFRSAVGSIWDSMLGKSLIVVGVALLLFLFLFCFFKWRDGNGQALCASTIDGNSKQLAVEMEEGSGKRRQEKHGKNFCPHCGASSVNFKFCSNCGVAQ